MKSKKNVVSWLLISVAVFAIFIYSAPRIIENITAEKSQVDQAGKEAAGEVLALSSTAIEKVGTVNDSSSQLTSSSKESFVHPYQQTTQLVEQVNPVSTARVNTDQADISKEESSSTGGMSMGRALSRSGSNGQAGEGGETEVLVANPVLSDEQLIEQIKLHQQRQEEINQAVADREEKSLEIHQSIVSNGGVAPLAESGQQAASASASASGSDTAVLVQKETPSEFVVRAGGPSL